MSTTAYFKFLKWLQQVAMEREKQGSCGKEGNEEGSNCGSKAILSTTGWTQKHKTNPLLRLQIANIAKTEANSIARNPK